MQHQALKYSGSQADPTSSRGWPWADIIGIVAAVVAITFISKPLAAYIWWTAYLVKAWWVAFA